MAKPSRRFLRRREVEELTGKCRSSIYSDPTFPAPVSIGPRAVAWLAAEVEEWMAARIADRDAKLVEAKG